MILGYNTNGFAFHRLVDAIEILAEIGYRAVAITLDFHALNPFGANHSHEIKCAAAQLERLGLVSVVETGARFLLDPRRKHQPTLISATDEERRRRVDFLLRAIDTAAALGAEAVSFWSGAKSDEAAPEVLRDRLLDAIDQILPAAERNNVALALEPEPQMFIDTVASARDLFEHRTHRLLGLTLDVGHLHCQREGNISELIRDSQHKLINVHIEDMRAGVHDHLQFGEGEIDFPPVLGALRQIGYSAGVYVELSRHSHDAVESARTAFRFLDACAEWDK